MYLRYVCKYTSFVSADCLDTSKTLLLQFNIIRPGLNRVFLEEEILWNLVEIWGPSEATPEQSPSILNGWQTLKHGNRGLGVSLNPCNLLTKTEFQYQDKPFFSHWGVDWRWHFCEISPSWSMRCYLLFFDN